MYRNTASLSVVSCVYNFFLRLHANEDVLWSLTYYKKKKELKSCLCLINLMLSSVSLYTNYLLFCMYHIYTAMNFDSSVTALTLFTNLNTY